MLAEIKTQQFSRVLRAAVELGFHLICIGIGSVYPANPDTATGCLC